MNMFVHRRLQAIGTLAALSMFAAWGAVSAIAEDAKAPDYDAIVASPDRSDADRQADRRRQPARMLAFAGVIERFVKDKFDIRAQKPALKNVVHVVRDFDDPIPPEVNGLDLITFFFAYHDITYMQVDRAAMNRKMFAALKPGGFLVIADHSARPGDGTSVAKTLHRIEESTLRQEIEAAGFKLASEADFLRHPEDPRDAGVFRPQIPTDEFVLKYQKPL